MPKERYLTVVLTDAEYDAFIARIATVPRGDRPWLGHIADCAKHYFTAGFRLCTGQSTPVQDAQSWEH